MRMNECSTDCLSATCLSNHLTKFMLAVSIRPMTHQAFSTALPPSLSLQQFGRSFRDVHLHSLADTRDIGRPAFRSSDHANISRNAGTAPRATHSACASFTKWKEWASVQSASFLGGPHTHQRAFATVAMEAGGLEEVVGRLVNHALLFITGQRFVQHALDTSCPATETICERATNRTGSKELEVRTVQYGCRGN